MRLRHTLDCVSQSHLESHTAHTGPDRKKFIMTSTAETPKVRIQDLSVDQQGQLKAFHHLLQARGIRDIALLHSEANHDHAITAAEAIYTRAVAHSTDESCDIVEAGPQLSLVFNWLIKAGVLIPRSTFNDVVTHLLEAHRARYGYINQEKPRINRQPTG